MLSWTRLSIDQSSLQGCTGVTLQRSDLQGGGNRVRERSTKAIRYKVAHPSNVSERSSAGLYPMYAGLWTLTRTYTCTVRDWSVKEKQSQIQTHMLQQEKTTPLPGNQPAALLTSEGPRTRLRCRVRPHAIFPCGR